MTLKAQIFMIVVLVVAFLLVLNCVRKKNLQLKYALPWFACIAVLILLVAVPNLLDLLAGLLGIQSPVNMVFFLGFVVSLGIIFVLTLIVSRLTSRVRQLAQAVALLEKRLNQKDNEK